MGGIVAAMPGGQFARCTVVFHIPTLLIDLLVALLTGSGRSTYRAGNLLGEYSVKDGKLTSGKTTAVLYE